MHMELEQRSIAEVVWAVYDLPLEMFYRVVLIFSDTKNLAAFVEYLLIAGEVYGNDYTFVGFLTEGQIRVARLELGAYVRAARVGD